MNKQTLKESILKAGKAIYAFFPMLFGTMLLVSLASLIPKSFYTKIFTGNFFDPLIGSIVGSILAGNPMTSYIMGGEFLKQGVSLIAITAFLASWVTVGLVQLPAEAITLGKKFTITRNILSFIFSIIIAIITAIIYSLI